MPEKKTACDTIILCRYDAMKGQVTSRAQSPVRSQNRAEMLIYSGRTRSSTALKLEIRVQERPEDTPTGELPRSLQLVVDRQLVGVISPGTRVTAYGIYSVYQACHSPCPARPRLFQLHVHVHSSATERCMQCHIEGWNVEE